MTPVGGKQLTHMRLAGKRPPAFVVVTESRDVANNARARELYPLIVDPAQTYDWTLLHGLDVGLVTLLRREAMTATCQAILEAKPATFYATYIDFDEEQDRTEHDRIIPYAIR